jgi:hypothetical protein
MIISLSEFKTAKAKKEGKTERFGHKKLIRLRGEFFSRNITKKGD